MPGICMKTENDIVNKVGKMRFSGNVIPEAWYKTIVSSNGRVNLLAINILADIVYWYRPMEIRDEMTGDVTWKKKFADDDYLQRNYERVRFRELIRDIGKSSIVLLSTHIVSDVEHIADHILMMKNGQLLWQGEWKESDGSLEEFYLREFRE